MPTDHTMVADLSFQCFSKETDKTYRWGFPGRRGALEGLDWLRNLAGGTWNARLKARLNASSDSYPTSAATWVMLWPVEPSMRAPSWRRQLAVACTTQCPYCIEVHAKAAKSAGATREEIVESAFLAAALRAGGAATHGAMTLKFFDKE